MGVLAWGFGWWVIQQVVVRTCTAPSATLDKGLWYSSDATVTYDIEGGGKGARRGS
ncbi:hypothetical protein ACFXMT_25805 [Streptomyces mirabilis]|uniref:hypothetical protein n=1 Tax=Streptomyces TaxID=1883 RepID=UPI0013DECB70|nr:MULTISPECIES: hypothetical protein [Streptomyces]MCX4426062.1 hypothetical protein [Streptomyces mirabilis]